MEEGRRWAIEDAFESAETELGLAHTESRSWHGWHRHVSSVMLAFAILAQRRIEPAFVLAWSAWRRAHQAVARQAHLRKRAQL